MSYSVGVIHCLKAITCSEAGGTVLSITYIRPGVFIAVRVEHWDKEEVVAVQQARHRSVSAVASRNLPSSTNHHIYKPRDYQNA